VTRLAFSAALLALALASPAGAARKSRPVKKPRQERQERRAVKPSGNPELGTVMYLTASRAYLDRGHADGLAVGTELKLERQGRDAGACKVDSVGDHVATCVGAGVRLGDAFRARRGEAAGGYGPPGVNRASPPSAETARLREAVVSAPISRVEFRGGGGPVVAAERRGFTADARLTDYGWFNGGANFHQERADVAVRGAPLPLGLRLDVDASAMAWTHRPGTFLSPQADFSQIWVRQAAVSGREPDRSLTFAVGRLWPWGAPGVAAVDGAQVGWRAADGSWEAGAFGGGVPNPLTTAPGFDRNAFGGYFAGRIGDRDMLLSHEGRLSRMAAPEYGSRWEAEERVRAYLFRALDLGAEVRFGVGGAQAPWALDAARLDADWRIGGSLRVDAAARYVGSEAIDLIAIGALAPGTRSLHGDATIAYSPAPWVTVSLLGSGARDLDQAVGRGLGGAEMALPSLFGAAGGLSAGWLEERGWIDGRSPFVQFNVQPWRSVRLLGRLTYADQSVMTPLGPGPQTQELSLFVSAEYAVTRWLTARCLAVGRTELLPLSGGEDALPNLSGIPNGLTVQASLGANL